MHFMAARRLTIKVESVWARPNLSFIIPIELIRFNCSAPAVGNRTASSTCLPQGFQAWSRIHEETDALSCSSDRVEIFICRELYCKVSRIWVRT